MLRFLYTDIVSARDAAVELSKIPLDAECATAPNVSVVEAGSMVVFLKRKDGGYHKVLTGEGMVGWIVCPLGVSMRSCFQLQRSTSYASW